MSMQLEHLKLELDRVREERDQYREALEGIANGERRFRKDGPGWSGGETWYGFAVRVRGMAVGALARAGDAAAARALDPDSCTHREGDGVCIACCDGEAR